MRVFIKHIWFGLFIALLAACSSASYAQSEADCLEELKEQTLSGSYEAAIQVGRAYYKGICVVQSNEEALKWFEKAALLGSARIQHMLGTWYHNGYIVKKDLAVAARYFLSAANQGRTDSMDYLSVMYANGTGIEQDYKKSYYWLYVEHQGDFPKWVDKEEWKRLLTLGEITEVEEKAKQKIGQLLANGNIGWVP